MIESESGVAMLVHKSIRESNHRNWRCNLMPEKSRVYYLKITRHIFKREMKVI